MARVTFTDNLRRHVDCPPAEVGGGTVRDVLEATFKRAPKVRGYILDDQSALRKHINVFVDGEPVRDRNQLSDPVSESAEVYVMQALSGG